VTGERDATASDLGTTDTNVESPAPEAYPAAEDGVEATGGVRGAHSHSSNPGQPSIGLDTGVDAEHLRSPSQGSRPEGPDDATDPTLGPDERPGR
jgi:hypothetical protein